MRCLIQASLAMAGVVLLSSGAAAFSCSSISKEPGDLIFVGTVTAHQRWSRSDGASDEYSTTTRVIFKVEKIVKGLPAKKRWAVVETSGMVEYPLYLNKRYLVHAIDRSEQGLPAFVDYCGPTNEVK
jgi:hypothetical protein